MQSASMFYQALAKGAGETEALMRNGYFRRVPHQTGCLLKHNALPAPLVNLSDHGCAVFRPVRIENA